MPLSLEARYGLHRVVDGNGAFPQPAWKLDPSPRISDAEILIDVERLNLDSANFHQIAREAGGDPDAVAAAIAAIVAERGKLHNPVTGSGGMLIGTVREVGSYVRESRAVEPGQRIALVGGGGTAGLLTLHEARKHAGPAGTVIVTDVSDEALADVRATGLADHAVAADATEALGLYEAVMEAGGREADVAVNLVNVAGTELGTILLTRDSGTILFFSMATSFTTAALGAEGLGRATTMLIGNGHMPDMGLTALNVLRESPAVRAIFERRYAISEAAAPAR